MLRSKKASGANRSSPASNVSNTAPKRALSRSAAAVSILGVCVVVMCPTMTRPAAADIDQTHQLGAVHVVVRSNHNRSHEAALERERRGRRTGGDAQLREDVLQVAGHGVFADHQRRRDLPV